MKIAFVANTSWNLYNFRLNLIQGFLAKGYEVICIAPYDSFSDELKKLPLTFVPIKIHSKGSNPFQDFKLLYSLYKIYKQYKPDIILQYTIKPNIYGTFAAAISGKTVINTVTGLGTVFLHNNFVSILAQKLYALSFRFARKVVFQNEDDRQLFIQKKLVKPNKTLIIRGSGVNVDVFKPKTKFGYTSVSNPFRFLMVARLLYDKGIREYAQAAKRLKESFGEQIECILIGAVESDKNLGIQKNDLQAWANANKLTYKSFSADILDEYQEATVVVLPSYREGLPKSLLEAAACEKPLVASNVAGCKDIVINDWNGRLCKVQDTDDLFYAMTQMYNTSAAELSRMAGNSRALVEKNFSDKIIFNEYFCLVKAESNQ